MHSTEGSVHVPGVRVASASETRSATLTVARLCGAAEGHGAALREASASARLETAVVVEDSGDGVVWEGSGETAAKVERLPHRLL